MPAVDPRRLDRALANLQEQVADPPAARRAIIDLLEFYAKRVRRGSHLLAHASAERAYQAPPAVMGALERALLGALQPRRELAAPLAEELWEEGSLEARSLASSLVCLLPPSDALAWVEGKAQRQGTSASMHALAACAASVLADEGPGRAIRRLRAWLAAAGGLRRLALAALAGLVEKGGDEWIPPVMRTLKGLAVAAERAERRALAEIIVALSRQSPQETTRWIMDGLREGWLSPLVVRAALPGLPESQRMMIRPMLRA
jgi:hypothetical protein